jgi:transposase
LIYSTGGPDKKNQGGITKTGNAHLRRFMTKSAWAYRYRPQTNLRMQRNQGFIRPDSVTEVCEIAWKA